ncbi:hypothetical protein TNCV_294061 [Trichonephila clavipes]|nr:hypothetical protein TNCV_294061 [Trichonephila clavipes]
MHWPLAKVIRLIPGKDGKIRTVELKTRTGTMLRPIQRVYPLEVQSTETPNDPLNDCTITNPISSISSDNLSDPNDSRKLYLPLAYISFLVRLAARRLHESNLLESSKNAFKFAGSIAFHHLPCYLATLDLNTLSKLNIPFIFLKLIESKREFPKKTPKKISGKVPYRFVTNSLSLKKRVIFGRVISTLLLIARSRS